jgi:hypothetical protein
MEWKPILSRAAMNIVDHRSLHLMYDGNHAGVSNKEELQVS